MEILSYLVAFSKNANFTKFSFDWETLVKLGIFFIRENMTWTRKKVQGSDATNSEVSPFDGEPFLCPSNDPDQGSVGPTAWHNPDATPEPSTLAGREPPTDPHPPGAKLMKSNLSLNIGALAKLITITYLPKVCFIKIWTTYKM